MTLLEKAGHGSEALKATDRDTLGWKEASLMDRPWFDRESGTLILDEYLLEKTAGSTHCSLASSRSLPR